LALDFILDYETAGQNVFTCPVLNVAFYSFDRARFSSVMEPYYFSELIQEIQTIKYNLTEQVKSYGYKIEKSTIDWWLKKGELGKQVLAPSSEDSSLYDGMKHMLDEANVKHAGYWWSRGNTFDPIISQRISQDTNQAEYFASTLRYFNVRDTRTYFDAKFDFKIRTDFSPFEDEKKWKEVFQPHNSVHDVAADIMRMQAIIRGENGLDNISR
jgi:hypothetical protein